MSDYPQSPSVNPYWYYDPYGYTPNVSLPFQPNLSGTPRASSLAVNLHRLVRSSVNTPPPHPSFELYNNQNQTGHFGDSGYLSRTPTPPTPVRQASPAPPPMPMRAETSPLDGEYREKHHFNSTNFDCLQKQMLEKMRTPPRKTNLGCRM